MSTAPLPWPDTLAGTPAVTVIERAIDRQRLANSLLLHGENLGTLANVAHGIADRLLNLPPKGEKPTQYFPPKQHPDFFALRPAGKTRQISAETTRDLIGRILVSPQVSRRKVAVVYEADRMNVAAANIFLKTLEEPTASTTILLLTTRPYSLLPTIRSRCLHFRFTDAGGEALADADEATRAGRRSTSRRSNTRTSSPCARRARRARSPPTPPATSSAACRSRPKSRTARSPSSTRPTA